MTNIHTNLRSDVPTRCHVRQRHLWIQNGTLSVVTGLFDLNRLVGVIWALPLIPLGVYSGRWIIDRINKAAFEWFMLVVLVIASVVLLLKR